MKLKHTDSGWVAHWREGDRRRSRTLGFCSTDEAHRMMAVIGRGVDVDVRLARFRSDFARGRARELGGTTVKYRSLMISRMLEAWGDVVLSSVTGDQASEFIEKMDVGLSTKRYYLTQCRGVFAAAIEDGACLHNPFADVKVEVPQVDAEQVYVPTDRVRALIGHADLGVGRALCLTRFAGLRHFEAARITAGDLDWEHRTIVVAHEGERTSKRKRREVPMTSDFVDLYVKGFDDTFQFRQCEGLRGPRDLHDLCRKAGVDCWSQPWHSLRKSFESDLFAAGYPILDVCSWLGHSPAVAAKHYHRTTPEVARRVRA